MNHNKVSEIEIQAPGKNLFFAKEAIKCGADSVYIGASKFSMRYEYGNDINDIKELVEYAHKYWVKVYVPVNTLLYTQEDFSYMYNLIKKLYEIGVDAIIIQDMGILELDLPPIPIFLGTNTACFSKEVIDFYKNVGISRVILPRELTYDELKEITEYTDIDIEIFCYGYLCVGYSGKCYLAYIENLAKGFSVEESHYLASNYGVCPERCMSHWDLYDADDNLIIENERLLNLKFLNLADEIPQAVDIGIFSFKIAGREKDLKHVKNSVANYNIIADNIVKTKKNLKRASSGKVLYGFEPDFYKNFNKGYTNFFFNGRKPEMYSDILPVGYYAGTVSEVFGNAFKLDTDVKLSPGDKLRYKPDDSIVKTLSITAYEDGFYYYNGSTDDIKGLRLYRYIYAEGFREVENSINYRVISVALTVTEHNDNYLIVALDSDNNHIEFEYPKGKKLILKNNIIESLYKVSPECEFVIDSVSIEMDILIDDTDSFLDEIFKLLREKRAKNRPLLSGGIIKNDYPYPKKNLIYSDNVTNSYAEKFYKRHGVERIETALENTDDTDEKKVFASRYCLKYETGYCSRSENKNVPAEPWKIVNKITSDTYRIESDCSKCEMYFYYEKPNREAI